MAWEQQAAQDLSLPWRSRIFIADNGKLPDVGLAHDVLVRHIATGGVLNFRRAYYQWLNEEILKHDLVLLRYSSSNPLQLIFIRRSPKPVLLVHHTLEGPELSGIKGLGASLRSIAETILGPPTLRLASGGVAVTREISLYERKRAPRQKYLTLIYPNGTAMSDALSKRVADPIPRLLFVASRFFPWHGLDKLITAAARSNRKFIVDVVGEVDASDLAACRADGRFILHGLLDRKQISDLAATSWAALSSFGLERKNMQEACTLKVREYLSLGIPVYSGHKDVFPSSFKYYRYGDCDLAHILDFAEQARDVDPSIVSASAEPYIDKRALLDRLYKELGTHNFKVAAPQ
jgi:hypothetical protein